jgi:hypothetical protein
MTIPAGLMTFHYFAFVVRVFFAAQNALSQHSFDPLPLPGSVALSGVANSEWAWSGRWHGGD